MDRQRRNWRPALRKFLLLFGIALLFWVIYVNSASSSATNQDDSYTALLLFPWSREVRAYSPDKELTSCLARDLENDPSFNSKLEFRDLDKSMFNDVGNPSNVKLLDIDGFTDFYHIRFEFGSENTIYRADDNGALSKEKTEGPAVDVSCHSSEKGSGSSHITAVLGGVLGGLAGMVITVSIIWMFCTKKRRASDRIIKNMFRATEKRTKLNSLIFKSRAAAGAVTVLSLQEVSTATNKFSRKIGSGGFGSVYHGTLPSGQEVAVKVKSVESRQGMSEFLNEIDLLSRIHHRNLVSLVGYCGEAEQQILFTVFLPNGTLRSHLCDVQSRRRLNWKKQLDIALNAAKGINYLHTDCVPRIIHRDVKSSNILLDEAMVAKVADFGISKQAPEGTTCSVDTILKGTLGYIDPEYFLRQRLTPKSDVYSFGIVLLEIISGRHPLLSDFPDGCETLLEWAEKSVQAERHADLIDSSMRGKVKYESMMAILSLALSTTARASADRPDMADIVSVLREAIEIEHCSQISFSENNPSTEHSLETVAEDTSRRENEVVIVLQNIDGSDAQRNDGTILFPR